MIVMVPLKHLYLINNLWFVDICTQQIALRATERDVYEFFSRAGKVGPLLFGFTLQ